MHNCILVIGTSSHMRALSELLSITHEENHDFIISEHSPLVLDARLDGMNILTLLSWAQDSYSNLPIALAVCEESSIALPDIVQCVEAVFVPKTKK